MLSISTAWNYRLDMLMEPWLEAVMKMGFTAIELSYRLTHEQLEEIVKLTEKMRFKVSSIHGYCPTPNDGPSPRHASNYYRLSSLDEKERQKAVKWTKISIDTASSVGAEVVVIHAGTVEIENDPSSELFQLYMQGKFNTPIFSELRERFLKLRAGKKEPHIEALIKSFKEVMPYAQQRKIKIGLETRYYPNEMPNFEEIGFFLNLFNKQGMGYWHDVGHAELNDRLGITKHLDFLTTYEPYLIGMHIHGMKHLKDHYAPFEGDMDLDKVMPFLKKNVLRVIESHSIASKEALKLAVKKLKE